MFPFKFINFSPKMASSHKAFTIICQISQSPSSTNINHNLLGFTKSTINPPNLSISNSKTTIITPSNQQIITTNEDEIFSKFEKKLSKFKHMLSHQDSVDECLDMIDAIQRLGIDHHFPDQIDDILKIQYKNYHSFHPTDLHEISLRFRLLRQHGYYLPPSGMLKNFKDKDGRFKKHVKDDVKGIMGLYEASQLSTGKDDDGLDEATSFSHGVLSSLMKDLDHNEARLVKSTMDHPHHKSLARLMAENYCRYYDGGRVWWRMDLQEISNVDLKLVQSQYRQEILEVSRWWDQIGLSKELNFARNQPTKWYLWAMAIFNDPNLSEHRIDLTKPISFIYLIDDIFDVYATPEELVSFTQVIDRWDIAESEKLPDYMRICFKALDEITNEISYKIYKRHGLNPVDSLRKTWGNLCKAFLVESKWFSTGEMPNAEEYLKNGIVSSGAHVVLVHIFFLLGHGDNLQALNTINDNPAIISSVASILRLWDDLGSAKDEDQNGYDGSYVELYMKENNGCTIENARKQVVEMISDSWKKLNQECLNQTPFSSTYKKCCLNLARMVPLMYSYDDNQDLPILKRYINSFLRDENVYSS